MARCLGPCSGQLTYGIVSLGVFFPRLERRSDGAVHRPAAAAGGHGQQPAEQAGDGERLNMAAPIIELRDVSKSFLGVDAVKNSRLRSMPGECCVCWARTARANRPSSRSSPASRSRRRARCWSMARSAFSSPRDARERGIATVYQEVGTLPLMSVARNFVLAAEPTKGRGLFRRLDLDKRAALPFNGCGSWASAGSKTGTACRDALGRRAAGAGDRAGASFRRAGAGARRTDRSAGRARIGDRAAADRTVRSRGVAVVFITHNAYHAHSVGDDFVILRRGEMLDSSRGATKLSATSSN